MRLSVSETVDGTVCGSEHIGPVLGYCPDMADRSAVGVCDQPGRTKAIRPIGRGQVDDEV